MGAYEEYAKKNQSVIILSLVVICLILVVGVAYDTILLKQTRSIAIQANNNAIKTDSDVRATDQDVQNTEYNVQQTDQDVQKTDNDVNSMMQP